MSGRRFPEVDIGEGGEHLLAHEITCSVCGAVAYFPFKRRVEFRPPHAIAAHFRVEGWSVGAKSRTDLCPVHAVARRGRRPASTKTPEETKPMTTPVKAAASPAAPKADPPKTMSRADRRIVHAKIAEVYDDRHERYFDGWTDAKGAADLGQHVPVAWVREIRDLDFGPEGSNPMFDDFLKRQAAFATDREAVQALMLRHLEAGRDLRRRLDDLDVKAIELSKLAGRIEKEIGR